MQRESYNKKRGTDIFRFQRAYRNVILTFFHFSNKQGG